MLERAIERAKQPIEALEAGDPLRVDLDGWVTMPTAALVHVEVVRELLWGMVEWLVPYDHDGDPSPILATLLTSLGIEQVEA